jgi:hypothetical protein
LQKGCAHSEQMNLADSYLDKITGPVFPKVGECDA